ncbi:MAG: hypothetical protein ACREML_02775 [Vulcanimicrobiaceae bacterium]
MIRVHDSITHLGSQDAGSVVVAASHGGRYCGYRAAKGSVLGAIFSDAGVGLEDAGIAALAYLDALGIPAAMIDYRSARIGDGSDLARRGRISFCNETARDLGCSPGDPTMECADKMQRAKPSGALAPEYEETRMLLLERPGREKVWGLDSNSLVTSGDTGSIVVTGSHGGILGGRPETALRIDALAAVYNDAGVGMDDAGISRLPALDARSIAAVTVAADTARIGDARSTWESGKISHANTRAQTYGAHLGMSVPEYIESIFRSLS